MVLVVAAWVLPSAAQSSTTAVRFHRVIPGRDVPSPFTIRFGADEKPRDFDRRGEFFLPPFFYPLYEYEPAQSLASSPPSLPERRSSGAEVSEEPKPTSGVIIERRGNQFVRMSASEYNWKAGAYQRGKGKSHGNLWEKTNTQAPKLLPTILIFRDGRQEQTSNYMIIGGTLYEYPDYWLSSSSTKKITLAELDIEATLRSNQRRGVKFVLPSSPNEIMTRP